MKPILETLQQLGRTRRLVQGLYLGYFLVYVAALLMMAFNHYLAGAVLGFANMLFYFIYLRRRMRAYSNSVAQANVVYGLCAPLKETCFAQKGSLTVENFAAWQLLPIRAGKNSLLCRNAFSGRGFGLELTGCEATFHYPYATAKGTTDYRFLNGTLLTATQLSTECTCGDWLFVRKNMLDSAALQAFVGQNEYREVTTKNTLLEERFCIYTHTDATELPNYIARPVAALAASAESLGAVRLTADCAVVYLANRFFTGRTKVRELPQQEDLLRCHLPERDCVWKLFRTWAQTYDSTAFTEKAI